MAHRYVCARVDALVRLQMMLHCSSPEGIFLSTGPRADRWKGCLSSVVPTLCHASVTILKRVYDDVELHAVAVRA
jgi:hypothetical protein